MNHDDISILIAEDDNELRALYVEYLELFFKNIYEAKDGVEAYDIYKKESPDIIVSDIGMPRLDGLSLIKRIRKDDKKTQILILSAYTDKEMLLQAIKLHLFEYLIKPVPSTKLKEILITMISSVTLDNNFLTLSDGYRWEKDSKQLYLKEEIVKLHESEKRLLEILIKSYNSNVSNEQIHNFVFHDMPDKEYSVNSITSLIKRVRKKLPKDTISTNYSSGYTLNILK